MLRILSLLSLLTALLLASSPVARSEEARDPLFASFRDPPSHFRPFVRWWWNGGCVSEPEIQRELDLMKGAGIGGFEINTIAMPAWASPETLAGVDCVEWLSPEWIRLVRSATDGARERDMTADLIVGSGWPFGGRFLEGAERTQIVRVVKVPLPPFGTFEATLRELAA